MPPSAPIRRHELPRSAARGGRGPKRRPQDSAVRSPFVVAPRLKITADLTRTAHCRSVTAADTGLTRTPRNHARKAAHTRTQGRSLIRQARVPCPLALLPCGSDRRTAPARSATFVRLDAPANCHRGGGPALPGQSAPWLMRTSRKLPSLRRLLDWPSPQSVTRSFSHPHRTGNQPPARLGGRLDGCLPTALQRPGEFIRPRKALNRRPRLRVDPVPAATSAAGEGVTGAGWTGAGGTGCCGSWRNPLVVR